MSQPSELNVYFVLPSEDKAAECSRDMNDAFTCVKQYRGRPKWVLPSFVISHASRPDDVFVFQEFRGPAFESVKNSSTHVVIGAKCMLSCLSAGAVIPPVSSPVFTEGMRDLVVSCTGFDAPTKKKIRERVEYMAGHFFNELRSVVTHLVAHDNTSPKALAFPNKKNIKTLAWIEAVWSRSQESNVRGGDPEFAVYTAPLFNNLIMTCSGIGKQTKDDLKKIISENGGTFMGKMEVNVTNILLIEKPEGEKFKAALSWGIKCVKPNWVRQCVEKGAIVPFKNFTLSVPKASTPNKSMAQFTGNFSCISVIEPDRNVSNVDETASVAMSQQSQQPATPAKALTPPQKQRTSATCQLLEHIIEKASSSGAFLDGCNVLAMGFSTSEMEKLKKVLNMAGATRFDELTSAVTHVIVPNSEFEKPNCQEAHVVPLHWVQVSLQLKRPAPVEPHVSVACPASKSVTASPLSQKGARLLSRPESRVPSPCFEDKIEPGAFADELIERYNQSQPGVPLEEPLRQEAMAPVASQKQSLSYSSSCQFSQRNMELFQGLKFYLSSDLSTEESEGCASSIVKFGGTIVSKKFSGVPDFAVVPISGAQLTQVTALEVVNVLFVKDCIVENSRMPIKYYHQAFAWIRDSKPLTGCVICVTKYVGVERDFIECLIEILGGIAQEILAKKPKGETVLKSTHLVCSDPTGQKYEGARRWGLPVVHHNWLLKCAELGQRISEDPFLLGESKNITPNQKAENSSRIALRNIQENSVRAGQCQSEATKDLPPESARSNMCAGSPKALLRTTEKIPSEQSPSTDTPLSKHLANAVLPMKYPLNVTTKHVERPPSQPQSPPCAVRCPVFEPAPSPINRALERLRETPKGSPESNRTMTPETPYGACFGANPSPGKRKRLLKWMNNGVELTPDPPSSRPREPANSTPVSELLSRHVKSMMRKPEDQPPDDSPEPAPKRINLSGHHPKLLEDGLLRMMELENSYAKTGVIASGQTTGAPALPQEGSTSEPKIIVMTESQPNTEIGWEDPVDKVVAVPPRELDRGSDRSTQRKPKVFMFTNIEDLELAQKIILSSGGLVTKETRLFDKEATHLLAGPEVARGEKVMGSIGAGLWILHPSYLEELARVKDVYSVKEDKYEWGNPAAKMSLDSLNGYARQCFASAYLWRTEVHVEKKKRPFDGIKIAFKVSAERAETFKRLVTAGGGTVEPSSQTSTPHTDRLMFIVDGSVALTESQMDTYAKNNICCVSALYISDRLLRKPTAMEDNLIPGFRERWYRWHK